jgi:hypothetical protein
MGLWNWLNGKKTFIGLALSVLYYAGWNFGLFDRDTTVEAWLATLVGAGLVHKAVKA